MYNIIDYWINCSLRPSFVKSTAGHISYTQQIWYGTDILFFMTPHALPLYSRQLILPLDCSSQEECFDREGTTLANRNTSRQAHNDNPTLCTSLPPDWRDAKHYDDMFKSIFIWIYGTVHFTPLHLHSSSPSTEIMCRFNVCVQKTNALETARSCKSSCAFHTYGGGFSCWTSELLPGCRFECNNWIPVGSLPFFFAQLLLNGNLVYHASSLLCKAMWILITIWAWLFSFLCIVHRAGAFVPVVHRQRAPLLDEALLTARSRWVNAVAPLSTSNCWIFEFGIYWSAYVTNQIGIALGIKVTLTVLIVFWILVQLSVTNAVPMLISCSPWDDIHHHYWP